MLRRWLVVIVILVGSFATAFSGSAAQPPQPVNQDLDCNDFATVDEARAVYYGDLSDPYDLDGDDNGLPCEFVSSGGVIYDNGEDSAFIGAGAAAESTRAAESQQGGLLTIYVLDESENFLTGSCFLLEDPVGIASTIEMCDDDGTWDGLIGAGVLGLETAGFDAIITLTRAPAGYQLSDRSYLSLSTGTIRPVVCYFVFTPIQEEPTAIPTREATATPTRRPTATPRLQPTTTATPRPTRRAVKPTVESSSRAEAASIPDDAVPGTVTEVISGDHLIVERSNSQSLTIQLLGITAPSTGSGADSCFGSESRDALEDLVNGQQVYIELGVSPIAVDGTLLRYLWLDQDDGILVNERMVGLGFATVSLAVPDLRYAEDLSEAQVDAIEDDAGLWAECA